VEKFEQLYDYLLMRQAQILYPECEKWVMDLAMGAYFNSLKFPVVVKEPMIEINSHNYWFFYIY